MHTKYVLSIYLAELVPKGPFAKRSFYQKVLLPKGPLERRSFWKRSFGAKVLLTKGVFIWLMVSTCKSIFKTSVHLQHMNAILDVVIWRLRAEIEHLF